MEGREQRYTPTTDDNTTDIPEVPAVDVSVNAPSEAKLSVTEKLQLAKERKYTPEPAPPEPPSLTKARQKTEARVAAVDKEVQSSVLFQYNNRYRELQQKLDQKQYNNEQEKANLEQEKKPRRRSFQENICEKFQRV